VQKHLQSVTKPNPLKDGDGKLRVSEDRPTPSSRLFLRFPGVRFAKVAELPSVTSLRRPKIAVFDLIVSRLD
jgi:hypothetical protein